MRILIDGDILVYRCGFAAEKMSYYAQLPCGKEKYFANAKSMKAWLAEHDVAYADAVVFSEREPEPVENALYNVKSVITRMIDHAQLHLGKQVSPIVVLSGPTNFRNDVATIKPYKGNRDKAHKPVHGEAIREYMRKRYMVVTSGNEEADDVLGCLQYNAGNWECNETVIASIDKDLLMIPGKHYNFVKNEVHNVSMAEGDYNFFLQVLTGDSTDNIPGIKGVGPKTAEKTLQFNGNRTDWVNDITAMYREEYGDEGADDALTENMRLLWIRRYPDDMVSTKHLLAFSAGKEEWWRG